MSRLKVVAMTFMAAFMLSAVVTAIASAEVVLPEFTVESKFTASFGKSKLNASGAEIQSTEGEAAEGEPLSKKLAKATIIFKKSTLAGEVCTGLGEASGIILIPVEIHLVINIGGGKKLILFLVTKTTHIDCKFFATLVLVFEKSTILGVITPAKVKTNKFTLEVNAPGGKQEVTEYENNAGEHIKTGLKLGIDSGTENATGSQEDEKASILTTNETELTP